MNLDIATTISRILVPVAVFSALGLVRRYFPARRIDPEAQLDSQGNVEEFTGVNMAVYTCMIIIGIALVTFLHWALVAGSRSFADLDGPSAFRLFPSNAVWWFLPGFAALCLSWEVTLLLWSLLGNRRRVTHFKNWTSARAGYDSTRALRWMAVLIVMPIGIATVLAIPVHSTLREGDIVVGHYGTFARQTLPYSQARRLALIDGFRDRSGKFSPGAGMIVEFNNGTRWKSVDFGDFKSEVDPGMAEFLQRKTRLALERAETETDLGAQRR